MAPMVALRDGRWKLVLCEADPPLLHDLEADPRELTDLAPGPAYRDVPTGLPSLPAGAGTRRLRCGGPGQPGAAAAGL